MNKQRYLLVVSGPSGAGKDTVVSRMMQKLSLIHISTPRAAPRLGLTAGARPRALWRQEKNGEGTEDDRNAPHPGI